MSKKNQEVKKVKDLKLIEMVSPAGRRMVPAERVDYFKRNKGWITLEEYQKNNGKKGK